MVLAAGARLGPYEIVAPLGAGGMGEVYRAKDGRLNRSVAIKILSDESAADVDRRERFEREAKAISALDHPNICALYDVGEHEGTYFLVMPCLEGQTLAERIEKGPLPPDQAINYATEIATALDAAHRHGIIHRDLKPGNIMLTKTGVKLLDFGLAKLKKAQGPLGDTTMVKGTGVGTLLGTMPYMAPEQIEGREVDARSDIFALGAVIYEMVTGQRAFNGDSPASVIGAIMNGEPTPLQTVQPLAPVALEHVVTTCLAKDPDERWQSAADIARELRWVARPSAVAAGGVPPVTRRSQLWPVAVTTIAILAAGAAAWPALTPRTTAAESVRFPLLAPDSAEFAASRSSIGIVQFRVSPDGRHVVFVAAQPMGPTTLWVRALRDVTPRQLRDTIDAADPFWSPDSRTIGFFANGRLKTLDLASGDVRDLCPAARAPRGGTWNRDGVIVFGGDSGVGLSKVAVATGTVEVATVPTATATSHRWPSFLPDGRRFLYYARGEEAHRGIYVASLDGMQPVRVLDTLFDGAYANGHLLTMREGTLLAYPFDERSARITGDPIAVADRLSGSSVQRAAFSVSTNGVLAFSGALHDLSRISWFSRDGKESSAGIQPGNIINFRMSPDERQVALSRIDATTNTSDIWIGDLESGTSTRFTLHPMNDISPVWSPDGRRLFFRSDRTGGNFLFGKTATGGVEEIVAGRDVANPTDWSPNARIVIYHQAVGSTSLDLGIVDLEAPLTPAFLANTIFDEYDGRMSPDGRWVAYVSEESGVPEIYVQSYPKSGNRWPVSVGGGVEPRWRRDGRELFYLSPTRQLMSVAVSSSDTTFKAAPPTVLFQTTAAVYGNPYQTTIEPNRDGSRFLVKSAVTDSASASPLTIVLNWTADLHRR